MIRRRQKSRRIRKLKDIRIWIKIIVRGPTDSSLLQENKKSAMRGVIKKAPIFISSVLSLCIFAFYIKRTIWVFRCSKLGYKKTTSKFFENYFSRVLQYIIRHKTQQINDLPF